MEYIFDDDAGELGSEVEAYCQKCRTDGPHTVITRYEDEVRQVQCGTCGHVHVYKPARPEPVEEEIAEAGPGGPKRRQVKKLTWEEAMRQPASAKAKAYGFRDAYRHGDYLDHPKFGKGYVNEVVDDTKIEAVFKDGARILVHNRKDLAGAAPAKAPARGGSAAPASAARGAAAKAAAQKKPLAAAKPAPVAKPARATKSTHATKPARAAKPAGVAKKPQRAAAKPKARRPKPAARSTRRPARSRSSRRR